ncbi:MAG: radical SAM protein [Clostridia bacterium]
MEKCLLCGNQCGIDRETEKGKCQVSNLKIARRALHFFEEPIISGTRGSGTIFFCGCPLRCVFCQNESVSRNLVGREISVEKLVEIFHELEDMNAHNINLVNPTHYANEILQALKIYKPKIPVVWNTHGYDSEKTIEKTKGFVDIYLPDLKYFDDNLAMKYSSAKDYFAVATKAILAMRKNVADSYFDDGMMKSGLIVRHLILPKCYKDSLEIVKWLDENLHGTLVSIMSQYTPFGDLTNFPEINRKLFKGEVDIVCKEAVKRDMQGFFQDKSASSEEYIPKWDY